MEQINVEEKTKLEFDKLQFDLKLKGVKRTQEEIVKMLINFWKVNNKEFK